jgi:hypothetical protein
MIFKHFWEKKKLIQLIKQTFEEFENIRIFCFMHWWKSVSAFLKHWIKEWLTSNSTAFNINQAANFYDIIGILTTWWMIKNEKNYEKWTCL